MYQSWAKVWKISFNRDSERWERLLSPPSTHLGWLSAPPAVKAMGLEVLTICFRGFSSLRTDRTLVSQPHI